MTVILMFLAASVIKLHITSAYVQPIQPLATILIKVIPLILDFRSNFVH